MASSRKKPSKAGQSRAAEPWLDADEVPRAGLPDAAKMARRRKVSRWLVMAIVFFLFPIACIALLAKGAGSDDGQAADTGQVQATSPGRTVATLAVQAWLQRTPAPLPGGQIVAWTGADQIPVPSTEEDDEDAPTASTEVDHFAVVSEPSGALFTVSVQVAVDPRGGASVVSSPSISPVQPVSSDGWDSGSTWPGYESAGTVSSAVTTAINAWTVAFTGGDPDALRVAVGDPNEEDTYIPLAGVKSATATPGDTMVPPAVGDTNQDRLVVRVTVAVLWDGQQLDENSSQQPGEVDYDLLVDRASTAAPVVVAWGAPGSGAELVPYANALRRPDMTAVAPPSLAETSAEESGATTLPETLTVPPTTPSTTPPSVAPPTTPSATPTTSTRPTTAQTKERPTRTTATKPARTKTKATKPPRTTPQVTKPAKPAKHTPKTTKPKRGGS